MKQKQNKYVPCGTVLVRMGYLVPLDYKQSMTYRYRMEFYILHFTFLHTYRVINYQFSPSASTGTGSIHTYT